MTPPSPDATKAHPKKPRSPTANRAADPPSWRQVAKLLRGARGKLRAGWTLKAVLRDVREQARKRRLHPRVPEHVATVLRLDQDSPLAVLLALEHHEVLGLPDDVGDPDQVDAACAEVLRLCRPSQFSSPALRRLMEEVCARARDAREFLFFGEVEPGDGQRDGEVGGQEVSDRDARDRDARDRNARDRDARDRDARDRDALVDALTAPIAEPVSLSTDQGSRSA